MEVIVDTFKALRSMRKRQVSRGAPTSPACAICACLHGAGGKSRATPVGGYLEVEKLDAAPPHPPAGVCGAVSRAWRMRHPVGGYVSI
jgi:hypothetical protein